MDQTEMLKVYLDNLPKTKREKAVREIATSLYRQRNDASTAERRRTWPEGNKDNGGRWYPSAREDQNGDGSCVRSPSKQWPFSYMSRCQTRQHCRVLVEAALQGKDVPEDVQEVLATAASKLSPLHVLAAQAGPRTKLEGINV